MSGKAAPLNWTAILTTVVGLLVIGGVAWILIWESGIWHKVRGLPDTLDTIVNNQITTTILPDVTPLDCTRRVVTTVGTEQFMALYLKPNGAACADACLNASDSRVCEDGVCTGTCNGECPDGEATECPTLRLADALCAARDAGQASFEQLCEDGICRWAVVFNLSYFSEFLAPYDLSYENCDVEINSLASTLLCPGFIADDDPSKPCLASAFYALRHPRTHGVCVFVFDCARTTYAGNNTLGSCNTTSLITSVSSGSPNSMSVLSQTVDILSGGSNSTGALAP